jgi:hypothetical protein
MSLWDDLSRALDAREAAGGSFRLWLRDDDAIEPTPALDHLLGLTGERGVPVVLAVIPALADPALEKRVATASRLRVAPHGWRHTNHAPTQEKKQEFGAHRPLAELARDAQAGLARIEALFGAAALPLFVPPWNRMTASLAPLLPALGYRGVSAFGPEPPWPVPCRNTHLDLMDWRSRQARSADALLQSLLGELTRRPAAAAPFGILSHHLAHDQAAWAFLERLLAATTAHPACRWLGGEELGLTDRG